MPHTIKIETYYKLESFDWKILRSLEKVLKGHEYVNGQEVAQNAKCSYNEMRNTMRNNLVDLRLVGYEIEGYRLTILGFDMLALYDFVKIGFLNDFTTFSMIGTGKESDVYICTSGERIFAEKNLPVGSTLVLKFHRLGRISFRAVRNKREYKTGNKCSWAEMNRASANLEYKVMEALYKADFPVPVPYGKNRSCVCMEYIAGSIPLVKLNKAVLKRGAASILYCQAVQILVDLAAHGLVHGDLNEFNFLVKTNVDIDIKTVIEDQLEEIDSESDTISCDSDEEDDDEDIGENDGECIGENDGECIGENDGECIGENDGECIGENDDYQTEVCAYLHADVTNFRLVMIDFPQAISRDNAIAQEIYARDRAGIVEFFSKFCEIPEEKMPPAQIEDIERVSFLDVILNSPGHMKKAEAKKHGYDQEEYKKYLPATNNKEETTVDWTKKKQSNKPTKVKYGKQIRNQRKKDHISDMKSDFF